MAVRFRDPDGKTKYEFKIDSNKNFSELLEELYKKKPEFKKGKYDFILNTKQLNSNKTIIENEINDNDIIFINKKIPPKIKVKIQDTSQNINEIIECIKDDKSSILREKIIAKIKELKNENFVLLYNGDKLDEDKNIEENKIENNAVILLIKMNVTVKFKDPDGKSKYEFKIDSNKNFSELLEELYKKKPEFKEGKYDFFFNSKSLNSNKTIIANEINDNDIIFINKPIPLKIKVRISQNINEIIECEKSDKASIIREKIIDKKQELKNTQFYFTVNGDILDENKTLKENKIGNEDCILLIKNDEPKSNNNSSNIIAIIIKSLEPEFEYPFACKRSDRFSGVLEKLYKLESQCKEQNKELKIGGRVIDINLTLKENNINDGDIIDYKIIKEKKQEEEKEEEVDPNEISVIFSSAKFKFPLICNKKDIFKDLKGKFLEKKSEYKNKNVFFIVNANFIDTKKSIEENNIKDSDYICVNDY